MPLLSTLHRPLTHGFTLDRETKKKTLEEIAAAFGDKVVLVDENDVAAETAVMGDKLGAMQVESATTPSKV